MFSAPAAVWNCRRPVVRAKLSTIRALLMRSLRVTGFTGDHEPAARGHQTVARRDRHQTSVESVSGQSNGQGARAVFRRVSGALLEAAADGPAHSLHTAETISAARHPVNALLLSPPTRCSRGLVSRPSARWCSTRQGVLPPGPTGKPWWLLDLMEEFSLGYCRLGGADSDSPRNADTGRLRPVGATPAI